MPRIPGGAGCPCLCSPGSSRHVGKLPSRGSWVGEVGNLAGGSAPARVSSCACRRRFAPTWQWQVAATTPLGAADSVWVERRSAIRWTTSPDEVTLGVRIARAAITQAGWAATPRPTSFRPSPCITGGAGAVLSRGSGGCATDEAARVRIRGLALRPARLPSSAAITIFRALKFWAMQRSVKCSGPVQSRYDCRYDIIYNPRLYKMHASDR